MGWFNRKKTKEEEALIKLENDIRQNGTIWDMAKQVVKKMGPEKDSWRESYNLDPKELIMDLNERLERLEKE